jgi:hypothetical protein
MKKLLCQIFLQKACQKKFWSKGNKNCHIHLLGRPHIQKKSQGAAKKKLPSGKRLFLFSQKSLQKKSLQIEENFNENANHTHSQNFRALQLLQRNPP